MNDHAPATSVGAWSMKHHAQARTDGSRDKHDPANAWAIGTAVVNDHRTTRTNAPEVTR